jgi:hypothetical protein
MGLCGAQVDGSFRREVDVVCGEVQVKDGRTRPAGRRVVGNALGNENDAGDLDARRGLLGPQLASAEKCQVEVSATRDARRLSTGGAGAAEPLGD